ncbi:MAG TPA: T9SS type A sorting domain-containing protein [Ignavibacteriaceae bacterium]|nr:T9SS type A sorting domain-containing protein [Ignavibacteriaceae bacterium]
MEGWLICAADTGLNGGTITWKIEPSSEQSADSEYSAKYYIENLNDAGKIWITKSFSVLSSKSYLVTIHYRFASSDFGTINNFRIITGVHSFLPKNGSELTYQGETFNGCESDCGFRWLDKNFGFRIENAADSVWVAVGVWGTWETARTYYIDSLTVSIERILSADLDENLKIYFNLHQNYPNPFNPSTKIKFSLAEAGFTTLKIYNILGLEITSLVNSFKSAGNYEIIFDALGLPGGIYFCKLNQQNYSKIRKMVLLR